MLAHVAEPLLDFCSTVPLQPRDSFVKQGVQNKSQEIVRLPGRPVIAPTNRVKPLLQRLRDQFAEIREINVPGGVLGSYGDPPQ